MKSTFYILTASVILLSACGGKQPSSLEELKKQEAELQSKLTEVQALITKLDTAHTESGKLVEVSTITPQVFKTYITIQGRIDAEESVSLSSEMPGTISKINVKPGDEVSKGQVLAETDARAIQQSMSDLQTNMELVNQLYDKQKALWDQKIGTEVQFLQAKTQKESMEKKMATLQEQVRMTKIISPINGTVDAVDIKLGQLTAPGMPAIRVINFSNLKVKADLAESYASKVSKGNDVLIRFPDTDDTLTAKVSYAARVINPMTRTFNVEILLNNKKEFHPNQIANIQINDYTSSKPVIVLPIKYIQKDVDGQKFVLVANGNKAQKQPVVLGKEYNGSIEVKEGLTETSPLITTGFEVLNDGDVLNISSK